MAGEVNEGAFISLGTDPKMDERVVWCRELGNMALCEGGKWYGEGEEGGAKSAVFL